MRNAVCELLEIGVKSYYVWKNKTHPTIVAFLEKYFKEEEIKELIETGEIKKLEIIKDKTADELAELVKSQHNEKILAQIEELKKQLL